MLQEIPWHSFGYMADSARTCTKPGTAAKFPCEINDLHLHHVCFSALNARVSGFELEKGIDRWLLTWGTSANFQGGARS